MITSPPYYGLRDYGVNGQIGLEESPEEYIEKLVSVFREAKRVLKNDGTLWLNLGDSYWSNRSKNGLNYKYQKGKNSKNSIRAGGKNHPIYKPKDLMGLPWRVALALQADGWYLRTDIIWEKPNAIPSSVMDRPTRSHEYIFLFSKSDRYFYDYEAVKEPAVKRSNCLRDRNKGKLNQTPGRSKMSGLRRDDYDYKNKRTVWKIPTKSYREAHFATFPGDLIRPCILAGCPENGVVLDMFFGSGTTGEECIKHRRKYIGIELNPGYIEIAKNRLSGTQIELFG